MAYSTSISSVITAPLPKVWDALTQPELVKQYFFGTNLETTWEVGAPIIFRGEWNGAAYEDKGTILSFEPQKSFSYNYWSNAGTLPDSLENYQILTFTVEEVTGGTKVTIDQSNVDTQEKADHSAENWKMVLRELEKLVTK
ncbi:MAG TPA: SRPBCC family protein [Candidatus Paceibacterota bacterium]|nr:SRPBCC family protein [Candidatus Paceibacterota bacterium]